MEVTNNYIKGFNSGYIIRKNHPLLMKSLIKGAKGDSEFLQGLKAGGAQYEQEMQHKIKEFNQERSSPERKKDHGFEM